MSYSRLSGTANILGGSSNLNVLDLIQGAQKVWEVAVEDDNGPVDITDFTLEATAKFYSATLLTKRTSNYAVVPGTFQEMDPQPEQPSLLIEKTDAAAGKFKFVLPDNSYTKYIPPDILSDVPIMVIFFRYTTGIDTDDDPQPILMHRLLVIIRSGISVE